ncbi:MAG: UDP-N-acetylmuramoyl-L-alanine--D-glutamate ligase [Candidatus Coatesbacteria bacterium]|nr:MAG: UDP-N-acetylmuramoyl-L-alanine--D-glutamate ligase [Candidatus Coatesbacteria bacterium]
MDFKGKRVIVIGMARAGMSAIELLMKEGADVVGVDVKEEGMLEGADWLRERGVKVVGGGYSEEMLDGVDMVVKSPGVEMTDNLVSEALKRGIMVIDELELAYNNLKTDEVIAVTGTNGKSTTVSLIGHILNVAGFKAFTAGNIGDPLSAHADEEAQFAVVEVSTFQLEAIERFKPRIGILLNITPDHLIRHKEMENYIDLKFRLFDNQMRDEYAILNMDDAIVWDRKGRVKSQVLPFTRGLLEGDGAWVDDGFIKVSIYSKPVEIIDTEEISLKGPHNLENCLASALACFIAGADVEKIAEGIKTFRGLPHRMEYVCSINNISFYNDSKATNPASMEMALRSFEGDIVLIAGGIDKGVDFSHLRGLVSEKVRVMVLLGEAREKMAKAFNSTTKLVFSESMEEAVEKAFEESQGSGVVLLSPGCASFDMFTDFEDRGERFKRAVRLLNRSYGGS